MKRGVMAGYPVVDLKVILYDGSYHEFRKKLTELGETPLPKYIKRAVEPEDEDILQIAKNRPRRTPKKVNRDYDPTAGQKKRKTVEKRTLPIKKQKIFTQPGKQEDVYKCPGKKEKKQKKIFFLTFY